MEKIQKVLDSFTFCGLWHCVNPSFKAFDTGFSITVECYLTVPDRIDNTQKVLTIRKFLPYGLPEEEIYKDILEWLHKFWEHEFYEGLFYAGQLIRNQHHEDKR